MRLKGSSIVITGASSGIGEAAARALARRGARVALAARRAERLQEIAEEIRSEGGEAIALAGDITSAADAARIVAKALEVHGGLDALFNNAGHLGPRVKAEDYPADALRTSLDVNIVGTFQMIQAALPALRQADEGYIVNMSSYLGRHGLPDCIGYVAGKFGLEGLTQALASELSGTRTAALTLAPGMVATDMLRRYVGDDDVSAFRDPADVGEGIARLFETLTPAHNGLVLDIDPWLAAP